MSSIFVRFPFKGGNTCLDCENEGILNCDLRIVIATTLHNDDFMLYCNGKKILENEYILPNASVSVVSTLPGGKGGFGSMLRAIGAQIEKTTNREACRDLSGRRLRDINEEQRLKKWIASKAEREADKIRRKKERLERLKSKPKHNFVDFEYEKEISQLPERIDEALTAGIQKVNKRPLEKSKEPCSSKKKRIWFDEDLSTSSESNTDSENESLGNLQSGSSGEQNSDENTTALQNNECLDSEMPSTSSNVLMMRDETGICSEEKNPETSLQKRCSLEKNETKISENETRTEASEIAVTFQSQINTIGKDASQIFVKQNEDIFVNIQDYSKASDLESLGLEKLKLALIARGLKCGGSVRDRAHRLWAVKDLEPHDYPKNLLAKSK